MVSIVTLFVALNAVPALMSAQSNFLDNSTAVKTAQQPAVTSLSAEQRGDILMARKMYREAIEVYHEGGADSALLHNKAGIAYHQMLQFPLAKREYEQAIHLNPRYAEAINNQGAIFFGQKSYRRAIKSYKRAIALTPQAASMHSNLGTAYFARKDYKDAALCYQTALSIDPDVFEHRSSFGTLLQERNVAEKAKFHYYLAKTYAKAGMNDKALLYMRKALEEGFTERGKFMQDAEFSELRALPEFQQLIASEPKVL